MNMQTYKISNLPKANCPSDAFVNGRLKNTLLILLFLKRRNGLGTKLNTTVNNAVKNVYATKVHCTHTIVSFVRKRIILTKWKLLKTRHSLSLFSQSNNFSLKWVINRENVIRIMISFEEVYINCFQHAILELPFNRNILIVYSPEDGRTLTSLRWTLRRD